MAEITTTPTNNTVEEIISRHGCMRIPKSPNYTTYDNGEILMADTAVAKYERTYRCNGGIIAFIYKGEMYIGSTNRLCAELIAHGFLQNCGLFSVPLGDGRPHKMDYEHQDNLWQNIYRRRTS